ncbi:hypothetical protein B7P43_G14272, partial [Cryptotermes secundus]
KMDMRFGIWNVRSMYRAGSPRAVTEEISKYVKSMMLPHRNIHKFTWISPGGKTHDQIVCIRQTLEKKLEYNETVYQLFIDFRKTYDSVRWEVLYVGESNGNRKT